MIEDVFILPGEIEKENDREEKRGTHVRRPVLQRQMRGTGERERGGGSNSEREREEIHRQAVDPRWPTFSIKE